MKLILASSSPRRKELLSYIRPDFTVRGADVDESLSPGEKGEDYVKRLSGEKARYEFNKDECVIGADTIVVIKGQILGKPRDRDEAKKMLMLLSNEVHQVLTGVTILTPSYEKTFSVLTEVYFSALSEDEIESYILTKEPMDKAGAYAIQGMGGAFIEKINGSYSNVVGLPLSELREELNKLGI